jgi:hypothetical protein
MKIKINLYDALVDETGTNTAHLPVAIPMDEFVEYNDIREHEVDVHEALAEQRAIALIWDAEMLITHYPHLTEAQAWDILQGCSMNYSAEQGLTWDDIAERVHEQYPDPADRQLPPDPEGKNDDRAAWALHAIKAFQEATGTEIEDALPDLLCDLMHWADRSSCDFDRAFLRAQDHYSAETAGGDQ